MRIDRSDLTDTIEIRSVQGQSGYGDTVYEAGPKTTKAYVDLNVTIGNNSRVVDTKTGEEVVRDGVVLGHPDDQYSVGDEIVHEGKRYRVIQVAPVKMGRHLHHYEVSIKSLGV